MTANELRAYLREQYGIMNDAQLAEEVKKEKIKLDIGCFASQVKA